MSRAALDAAIEPVEQALLCALCLDRRVIARLRARLKVEYFARSAHRRIALAMFSLFDAGAEVDVLTLAHALERSGELEACGGHEALAALLDATPTAANVETHFAMVLDAARRRQLLAALDAASTALATNAGSVADIKQALLEQLVFGSDLFHPEGFVRVSVDAALDEIQALGRGEFAGIRTGFARLDQETAGFRRGELCVVGAIPKGGKSLFSMQIALYGALSGQGGAAIVSAEMSAREIHKRMLSCLAGVALQQIARGEILGDGWPRLIQARERLNAAPLWIDDQAAPDLKDVTSRVLVLKAQHPELALIVVDFLQLIQFRLKGRRGDEELEAIAYALKKLAHRADVAVVAPTQLNEKPIAARADHTPLVSDLSGSSGPAKAADFVMLLHRPSLYDDTANGGLDRLHVAVASARRTRPFQFALDWQGVVSRVVDAEDWVAPNAPLHIPPVLVPTVTGRIA